MCPETGRALAVTLLLGAASFASVIHAQGPPPVAAELRIASAVEPLASSAAGARQRIEDHLAAQGRQLFGYLEWKPSRTTSAGGPRLVLRLVDDPRVGACEGMPVVWLQLLAIRSDGIENRLDQARFLEACDARIDWTAVEFEEEAKRLLDELLKKQTTLDGLEEKLLSTILLADQWDLTEDPKGVFLPLKPDKLKAHPDSSIWVRFGPPPDHIAGEALVRPRSSVGDRTQVFLREFRCGFEITSGGPLRQSEGLPWHELFEQFVQRCSSPSIYMKKYVPAQDTIGGVVGSLDGDPQ